MDDFTTKMIDHARNPRNSGTVNNAHGVGHVESACGDWVQVTLRLDSDRRIEDCKFTAFGCGSAVASASVITEMAMGKPIAEADQITAEDVVTYLGGLPTNKTHCSAMSHAAFKAAVNSSLAVAATT